MADPLDVLTLAEAKAAINYDVDKTKHDNKIAQLVTAVSRRLDDLCGPIVQRERTELHDGGVTFIRPRKTPVGSVTSLTEYVDTTGTTLTAETNASKPTDGYLLDEKSTHNVRIIRRSGNADSRFPSGRRNVELVFQAGRAADTASVDSKFKQAAALLLSHIYKPNAAAWAQTQDPFGDREFTPDVPWKLPPSAVELIREELRTPAVV